MSIKIINKLIINNIKIQILHSVFKQFFVQKTTQKMKKARSENAFRALIDVLNRYLSVTMMVLPALWALNCGAYWH